ncbi:MAG: HyaD/HybD family hydrogenase maturation endopeptidase [Syntrophothermus sp.]|uniref:HyaD/HybD family hydrogenase maturation endopeptidase n=1 Tax=Syntrophothermus sp. TaxID=2736299 RepID=UPI00257973F9|nr:HyaD/HybD family hydrogenase maturation endopeptidase [Syntrophothermus sp.]NSW81842.1 HyaD/HybD family hydrogenase maturation endopeptidase [Syntrophothermus sp.]
MNRVLVVGIGNLLLKDEGVGVHAVQELRESGLPPGVEAVDIGTNSYDLVDCLCESDKLIVIDAMEGGGEPGTIYRVSFENLELKRKGELLSSHQLQFHEAVEMAKMMGCCPEITVIGIEPKTIDWGTDLSPEVQRRLPRVVELVLQEIERLFSD